MGLNFDQLRKNNSFHIGIKSSPYKVVFGIDTPLGVTSAAVPSDEFKTVSELFKLLGIELDKNEFYGDDEEEPEETIDVFDQNENQVLHSNSRLSAKTTTGN